SQFWLILGFRLLRVGLTVRLARIYELKLIISNFYFLPLLSTLTPYRNLPLHVRLREVVGSTRPCNVSVQGLFSYLNKVCPVTKDQATN
uniref:Uncharacterized protein n=1 Tax=Hyaloperonospora arabidopsidis (strain Emoy2) TaxID=559515 RepID=M4C6S3_HYAAE